MSDVLNPVPSLPFLVEKAQLPVSDETQSHDDSLVAETNEAHAGIFHTRCGHPRRRDD